MSRNQFKMAPEQMERILAVAQPRRLNTAFVTARERNRVWQELAAELGFVWYTAAPVSGEGMDVFTAEVSDGE